MAVRAEADRLADGKQAVTVVDADTHNVVLLDHLRPYLSNASQRYLDLVGLRNTGMTGVLFGNSPLSARADAWLPDGGQPGTDPGFFAEQLLDEHGVDIAILNSQWIQVGMNLGTGSPPALIAELMRAANEQEQQHWLDSDPRFRGAICVAMEDPAATVAEIDRCAPDQRFVQVLLPFRTVEPLGSQTYWPMFEAAVQHEMPIGLHPVISHVMTGSGAQSFYFEHHVALPSALYSQISSLIFNRVFDRFPDLKFVIQEGGWSWVAPFMWRLDTAWERLSEEIPELQRRPSEYLRDHFWFTTQPAEEPEEPKHFAGVWDQFRSAGMANHLLFSSDYPHWDFDTPDAGVPSSLPEETRRQILSSNALDCYGRL